MPSQYLPVDLYHFTLPPIVYENVCFHTWLTLAIILVFVEGIVLSSSNWMWQKLDWFPQCPVHCLLLGFPVLEAGKPNHIPRLVSRERPQADALLQDLSLELSGGARRGRTVGNQVCWCELRWRWQGSGAVALRGAFRWWQGRSFTPGSSAWSLFFSTVNDSSSDCVPLSHYFYAFTIQSGSSELVSYYIQLCDIGPPSLFVKRR